MEPMINGQKMSNRKVISVIINHNHVIRKKKLQAEHQVAMDTAFL